MLYILLSDSMVMAATTDHTTAQTDYADATAHDDGSHVQLLQMQADVVQERMPPPPSKPVSNAPLTDAESRQLSELLARHQAGQQKEGA